MVEVVGTAPTSAMVITKFVYRRSWKTNIINIKGITIDSITIMKLTKDQAEEIENQQTQSNQTNIDLLYLFNEKGRSVARCPGPRLLN